MHMNAITRGFKAFKYQIIVATDEEFSHIFDSCLNLYHKNPILKNSKNTYAAICRPIALRRKGSLCFKSN